MIGYFIGGALVAIAMAFGAGWHYGTKKSAVEIGQLRNYSDTLAAQIPETEARCKLALDSLKAAQAKRDAAAKAAADAAAKAQAGQQATIDRLLVQAQTAADSSTNCAAAQQILDKLAVDRK